MRHDVAVVGLGAMGAAALLALARRGVHALGIERFHPGHARGSSHGESRVFRIAYFEHPSYVPLALAARDAWRAIERESGADLLRVTGVLEAGQPGSEIVAGSLRASLEHGLAHALLDAAAARARFPAFEIPDDWQAVFQPDAGILRPEAAIAAMLACAAKRGAETLTGAEVLAVEPCREGLRILLRDAAPILAGRVILAAGPWMGRLVPELAPALAVTRQVVGWFDPARPAMVTPAAMPVFILDAPEDTFYGFPDAFGSGVKAASHRRGPVVDPDAPRGDPAAELGGLAARIARYLPAAHGPLRAASDCLYTRAADEHFILGPHPEDGRIVLASPCSGHGFKFASIIGEILADLALEGGTAHDIGLFGVGRCWPA